MKKVLSFLLCALLIGLGGSFGYADQEEAGSSTDISRLQGAANTGRSTYTNVHSGRELVIANKVIGTDAGSPSDSHPLEPGQ